MERATSANGALSVLPRVTPEIWFVTRALAIIT